MAPDAPVKTIAELERGPLIHILGCEGNWERYFSARDGATLPGISQYFLDTSLSGVQMVACGVGYAMVLTRLIETPGGLAAGLRLRARQHPSPRRIT